jgi:HK97 family phage major capsid protein
MSNRSEVLARAEALLKQTPFSKQNEAMVNSLLRLADAMQDDGEKLATRSNRLAEIHDEEVTAELRMQEEFRHFVHRPSEKRTYAALETDVATGSATVPTGQWLHQYQERLVSASGFLRAGATLQNVTNGVPFITFFSDDTANQASIIGENSLLASANPVFSAPKPNVKNFATSTTVSNLLLQDAQFDLDGFLQGLFANRVARKFNNYASVDGTEGLFAQLTVGATSSSNSVPTVDELIGMQDPSVIDPAYLSGDSLPCYMVSPTLRTRLMKQKEGTTNAMLYPELKSNMLLGYPLITNVDQSAASGGVAVVFGSVKRAVLVQSQHTLVRSRERYAEFNQTLYGWVARMGCKLVDANAVTALKLA